MMNSSGVATNRDATQLSPDPLFSGVPAIAVTITFTEGPTCDLAGNLYFSDVRGNRIMRLDRNGQLSAFRYPANFANGMVCDTHNLLWVCEEGAGDAPGFPCVSCTQLDTGERRVVVGGYEGKRLRGPKDITFDGKGRLYFTDGSRPFFMEPFAEPSDHLHHSGVYRIDDDGTAICILGGADVVEPNGIVVSPDDTTLYVIENDPRAGGRRQLLAFALDPAGTPGRRRVLHDFGGGRSGDGLSVDSQGNLWVAAGLNATRGLAETLENEAGIYVFDPEGRLAAFVPIAEDSVTNTCFGGNDMRTLYVTAGKTIFTLRTAAPGLRR